MKSTQFTSLDAHINIRSRREDNLIDVIKRIQSNKTDTGELIQSYGLKKIDPSPNLSIVCTVSNLFPKATHNAKNRAEYSRKKDG